MLAVERMLMRPNPSLERRPSTAGCLAWLTEVGYRRPAGQGIRPLWAPQLERWRRNTLMTRSPQSAPVESLLAQLEADAARIREVMAEAVVPAGSPMFPLDFLAFAAVKRHTSTTSAFVAMVRAWNMVIARALLRLHIDTALRFSAAWEVAEPHAFATEVLKGTRIDRLKSRTGLRLTDSYLVQLRKEQHPWLPAVYEYLSGYVHFSGAHIVDAISHFGEEDRTIQFLASDEDRRFPDFSWTEILECFREATSILGRFLQGWGATKKLSDAQLQALRSGA